VNRKTGCDIVRRIGSYHRLLFTTRETNDTMTTGSETTLPRPFTLNDINVGTKLYVVLVRHARTHPGQTVFYGDLLDQARLMFPDDAEVERAVPIGIGMKLLFVQAFCTANGYPNLACLAVNKGRQIPGIAYPGDWSREMRDVAAFDWSSVQPELDAYVTLSIKAATPRKKRRETEARDLLFAHFREHRSAYKDFKHDDREEMVSLLMAGFDVDTALRTVLEAKAALDSIGSDNQG
jgi:hypothetical protein